MQVRDLNADKIKTNAMNFEGWLKTDEAEALSSVAENLTGNGCIVEIGSWCAKSLSFITAGAIKGNIETKIYSIDPFLTSKDEPNGKYKTFLANLKLNGIENRIIHIKEKSQIAGLNFKEKIEFIFIDGFHKYDSVKKDFEIFYPKVINNGYIAFHDIYSYWGPTKLLCEILENEDYALKFIKTTNNTVFLQKQEYLTNEEKELNSSELSSILDFMNQNEKLLQK